MHHPRKNSHSCKHLPTQSSAASPCSSFSDIPSNIHSIILAALRSTRTHGVLVEGTSGSTGISLASLCCSRGHAVIVVMPDDQSRQKSDFLRRLGCGVIVVANCGISNPDHYVNVARRVWEWLQVERRYDGHYAETREGTGPQRNAEGGDVPTGGLEGNARMATPPPRTIRAAFMNQFENLANLQSHYETTGPEIYAQLEGNVDAFVMSAGTGGTLVGIGGYLKEKWYQDRPAATAPGSGRAPSSPSPPRIVLVDPPGSSLFNKVKHGVAYATQQSEQRLRRHRYDTLAEGIGLDRVTANFGLGCESIDWDSGCVDAGGKGRGAAAFGDRLAARARGTAAAGAAGRAPPSPGSPVVDDALAITDQQAVHVAHYLLRHEGLFVGASTAMNVAGALRVAAHLPPGSHVVTVVCDVGARHTGRFWNRKFISEERGLVWPGDAGEDGDGGVLAPDDLLQLLGINGDETPGLPAK